MKKLLLLSLLMSAVALAQLSGTYSIGVNTVSGEAGNYASLSAAVAALNASGVNGPCTFYFTDNTTYSDTAIYLAPSGTSSTNTITFKPYTGVTATISLTRTANTGVTGSIDGAWSIGSPTGVNTNLVPTSYITIDGSNTNGGTTKDLTIQNASVAVQISVLRIFGNNDNITIKNCIITNNSTSGNTTAPINVTNYNNGSNHSPDNLTIQNNTLNSNLGNGAAGIHISNSGTPTVGITGLVVNGNTINARVRGMFVSYTNDGNIYGNTFSIVSQASQAAVAITFQTTLSTAGTFNVYNNRIATLTTLNATAGGSNGVIGFDIQSTTPKVFNVYNNMITGMGPGSTAATNSKIYGIRSSSSATVSVYHNTIYIPEMTNMTTYGTSFIAGIVYASTSEGSPTTGGSMTVKNNIIVSDETASTMKVTLIRRGGTGGTFTANDNNYRVNTSHTAGYYGFHNTTDQLYFTNWKSASSQDAASDSVAVTFTSTSDLHLASGSIGDGNLIGVTGLGISTDIDGDSRSGTFPYMGADEANTPLPVDLNSFTAVARGKNVDLQWTTAAEQNNLGFDVERMVNGAWSRIGFVQGAGNSNAPKEYRYTDAGVANGTVLYRLKQVDADGKFTYHKTIEVVVNAAVTRYELSQNYPNPFNPTTSIRFAVPTTEQATVKVYDMAGREVAVLFNQVAAAGQIYNVQFTGTGLASGIYLYVLQTQSYREVKKMSLLK